MPNRRHVLPPSLLVTQESSDYAAVSTKALMDILLVSKAPSSRISKFDVALRVRNNTLNLGQNSALVFDVNIPSSQGSSPTVNM